METEKMMIDSLYDLIENKGSAEKQLEIIDEFAKNRRIAAPDRYSCGCCEQALHKDQMICPICRTRFAIPDIDEESFLRMQIVLLDADIRYRGKSLEEAMDEKDYKSGSLFGRMTPNPVKRGFIRAVLWTAACTAAVITGKLVGII